MTLTINSLDNLKLELALCFFFLLTMKALSNFVGRSLFAKGVRKPIWLDELRVSAHSDRSTHLRNIQQNTFVRFKSNCIHTIVKFYLSKRNNLFNYFKDVY